MREILVRSAPESVVDNSDPPDINIQYAMALMLIDKTATFRSIHDKPRMQDPADSPAACEGAGSKPRVARRGAARLPLLEITLTTADASTQDTGPVLGTIENPMTREQLVAKCRDLMTPVLGESQTAKLVERVLDSIAPRTSGN